MTSDDDQSSTPAPNDEPSDASQDLRQQGAEEMMGPGFLRDVRDQNWKRRAYEFWYHPYTELAIFGLIFLSVFLLGLEVAIPTGEPIGWIGGLAAGGVVGLFFWADAVITLVFVVEYICKLWIAPKGRKWFFVRNSWIELLALLPILRVFRLFRIFRAVRVLRVIRVMRSVRLMRAGSMVNTIAEGFGKDLRQQQSANMIIIAYFVSAMVFGTIGVMIFERGAGSGFETIGDGLWWCVVTLSTVGYGDIVPETNGGRIVASIVVVMGLGFWSLVTGVFTSTLVSRARRKRRMGLDIIGIKDHIVIFGWNDNGARLLCDFRAEHPLRHLVVVTEKEQLGVSLHSRHHHICDSPTSEEALNTVQLKEATTVVVLAERQPDDGTYDVEARTMMQCLKARNVAPRSRIVVELLDETDIPKAKSAGADEVVVTENYAGALISQSVQSPGIHQVYNDLFDVGAGSKFGQIDVPPDCVGRPFSEAARWIFEHQQMSLVGIRRGDELLIAPDDEPTVGPDDRAIVIESVIPARSL